MKTFFFFAAAVLTLGLHTTPARAQVTAGAFTGRIHSADPVLDGLHPRGAQLTLSAGEEMTAYYWESRGSSDRRAAAYGAATEVSLGHISGAEPFATVGAVRLTAFAGDSTRTGTSSMAGGGLRLHLGRLVIEGRLERALTGSLLRGSTLATVAARIRFDDPRTR